MSIVARWAESAIPLKSFEEAAKHLTVGQVSDRTGLSQNTLEDSLTREQITNARNPRRVLCRPRYRFGSMPLWTEEQVQEYLDLARKVEEERQRVEQLPLYSPAEAQERNLVTTKEIAERFGWHGQTPRRYQRDQEGYPAAVGRLRRIGEPGIPDFLRSWPEMQAWAKGRGISIPS